jgi:hypothetical protein
MFFLRSCRTKQGEDDYRLVFDNFLTDVFIIADRSEWYASKIILTLLSSILMTNFSNHALTINTRLKSLDYLGSATVRLRKETIQNDVFNWKGNEEKLNQIVHLVKSDSTCIRLLDPFEY